ncbi:TetR/AcrR family transcriptional regulator [Streptomyces sp. NBC_00820]|uniref:TetR/AcrR family transcriptional regulator n=1 Tax=Streptomyces sp. NBC_00820 TaxID=2975842 RepID=UPI002ED0F5AB|nr:TetR/AcrR family transcriptional regulator [Streptomyces sp. NBC_00820]
MTPARTDSPTDRPRPGLRERKKTKTREAIRSATYALVEEWGYDATTVDRIAERAEVSPSTIFRYFPTKEDIVLTDGYDEILLTELRARPSDESWADSLRHAIGAVVAVGEAEDPRAARLRARLALDVPAVRARMTRNMSDTGRLLRRAIAERTGLPPDGLEARVHATSLVGVLTEVTVYWAEHGHEDDLRALLERAVTALERGLPGKKH